MEGNDNNRFYIVIKCPYHVYDEEWAEILFGLNWWFKEHGGGKFSTVGAFLEEVEKG